MGERYLGMFYFNMSNYDDAILHCKNAINYSEKTANNIVQNKENEKKIEKNIFEQASIHNILGAIFHRKEDYQQALTNFYKSIELYEKIKFFNEIPPVQNNIGNVFQYQKDYEKALYYFDLSIKGNEKNKNYDNLIPALANTANVYLEQGKAQKALPFYEKAYQILTEKVDNPIYKADVLLGMSDVYSDLKDYEKAILKYDETITFYETLGEDSGKMSAIIRKAEVLRILKQYENAEKGLAEGLILAEKLQSEENIKYIYEIQMKLFLQTNQPEKEEKASNNYKILEEKIRKKKTDAILYELETKYEVKQKNQQITLLDRDKKIQSLEIDKNIFEIKNKNIALDFADLENLRKQDTIQIKNISLEKNATEIAFQKAENEAKTKKIQLSTQEIALKNAAIENANLQKIILGISAFALLGLALFAFSRFRLAKAKQQITEQKLVQQRQQADILRIQTILDTQETERSRIADELHDGLGAEISSLKMMSEKLAFKYQNEPLMQENLAKLSSKSKETVDTMRQIVWAMGENHNQLEDLVHYLQDYAHLYLRENNLKIAFKCSQQYKNQILSFDQRHNIFLTFKEVLHNIVKHAHAKNVNIDIMIDKNIKISIQDDGVGIALEKLSTFGNGLKNLQKRMNIIKGSFEISSPNIGTFSQISMPLFA